MSVEDDQSTEVSEDEVFEAEMRRLNAGDGDAPPGAEDNPETKEQEEIKGSEESVESNENVDEEDELRQQVSKLQRALDRTNGTYGSKVAKLEKQIQQLTEQLTQPRQEANEEVREERKIELKRTKSQYEELGSELEQDLSEILASAKDDTKWKAEVANFQKQLDDERQAREMEIRNRELRILKREHPDYQEVASFVVEKEDDDDPGVIKWTDPSFGNWVEQQPEDIREEIINNDDAYTLSDHITAYKKSLKQKKQTNLAKAIQPKGVVSAKPSSSGDEEEEAFREEFRRLNSS